MEGPTTGPDVLALRARQKRALLLTLLLSAGVPLLLGGDELGRTQRGNNNAYCQDNEITWFDWSTVDHELLRIHKGSHRVAPSSPGVPQAPLPHRPRRCGSALVHSVPVPR